MRIFWLKPIRVYEDRYDYYLNKDYCFTICKSPKKVTAQDIMRAMQKQCNKEYCFDIYNAVYESIANKRNRHENKVKREVAKANTLQDKIDIQRKGIEKSKELLQEKMYVNDVYNNVMI